MKCAYCQGKYGQAVTIANGRPACTQCASHLHTTPKQKEIGKAIAGTIKPK